MGHDYMRGFGGQNRVSGSGIRLYLGFIYFASYLAQWASVLGWGEDSPWVPEIPFRSQSSCPLPRGNAPFGAPGPHGSRPPLGTRI